PSGVAFAIRLDPSIPPAPATFSKITGWPRSSERRDPNSRPITSAALPAADGYTMVSGRIGQSSAAAGVMAVSSAADAAVVLRLGIPVPPRLDQSAPHRSSGKWRRLHVMAAATLGPNSAAGCERGVQRHVKSATPTGKKCQRSVKIDTEWAARAAFGAAACRPTVLSFRGSNVVNAQRPARQY